MKSRPFAVIVFSFALILPLLVAEFPQNVGMRHSTRQVFQHIIHGDSQPPNAGFTTSFASFHRDDVRVRHTP